MKSIISFQEEKGGNVTFFSKYVTLKLIKSLKQYVWKSLY